MPRLPSAPDTCHQPYLRSPPAPAQRRNIYAPPPAETKEAFASASATYLSGHKRFDFLHVEIVRAVSCGKALTNHAEPPDSWPGHREAIVSSHVELLTLVILSCAEHAGNCSLPVAADKDSSGTTFPRKQNSGRFS